MWKDRVRIFPFLSRSGIGGDVIGDLEINFRDILVKCHRQRCRELEDRDGDDGTVMGPDIQLLKSRYLLCVSAQYNLLGLT